MSTLSFVEELNDDYTHDDTMQPNDNAAQLKETTTLGASLPQTDITPLIAYMERESKRKERERDKDRKLAAEQLAEESKKTAHAIDAMKLLCNKNAQLTQDLLSAQAQTTSDQTQLATSIATAIQSSLQSVFQSNSQSMQQQQSVPVHTKPKRAYKRKASDAMTPTERERVVASRLNRNELIEKIKQSGLKTKDRDNNIVIYTNFDGFYKDGSRWSKDAMINLLYPLR